MHGGFGVASYDLEHGLFDFGVLVVDGVSSYLECIVYNIVVESYDYFE